ncbi:MAG: RHS repeat-associated core domain-containing protein [Bellilinea sp.]
MLYKAWGELRYTTGEYSVRYKFTAQREEAALSLYDYRARFYDPRLGRFIQPDSLVPGAGNPLAWDRYAYTLNNPVRYTDPSGYTFLEPHGFSRNKELKLARFEGISLNSSTKIVIEQQTHAVANAYARTYNLNQYNLKRMGEISGYRSVSPELLFFQIHGGAMTYLRVAESCDDNGGGCAAETVSKNRIILYSNVSESYFLKHSRVIVHELGHAFNNAVGKAAQNVPVNLLRPVTDNDVIVSQDQYGSFGFAGGFNDWQFGVSGQRGSEEFADMFIGWVFGNWETSHWGIQKSRFMLDHMGNLLGRW